MTGGTVCAAVGLAGTGVGIGAFLVLHVLPTGLSPVRDAVSRYGISRYRLGYRILTVGMGAAGIALAIGVALAVPAGTSATGAVAALAVFGVARVVISWFPMDAPGSERTGHGTAHELIALVTFAAIATAAFQLRQVTRAISPGSWAVTAVGVVAWELLVAVVATFVTLRSPDLRRFFGIAERLIYLGAFVLLVTVAVAL